MSRIEPSPADLLHEAANKMAEAMAPVVDGDVDITWTNEGYPEEEVVLGFQWHGISFTAMVRLTP